MTITNDSPVATLPARRTPAITYRTANIADLPAMTAVLEAADLPARLIEPFIDTFLVAEAGGRIVACGGIELHDDTAVLRSVAVDDRLRGSGVGRGLADLLIDLAASLQALDIYLFTADAWSFWQKQGFTTIGLEDWREPARDCWQFAYVYENQEWAQSMGLRTMWMPAPR